MRDLLRRVRRAPAGLRRRVIGRRPATDPARQVLDGERALAGPRVRTSWDEAADAAYVESWAGAPGPATDGPWATVVMPVRNRPDAVLRAIASVQAQTLVHWRLVVVDDGSTDGTAEAVLRLAESDPRIELVRRDHEGVCAARNAGIEQATTPYVAFLDSDNEWTPAFLRTAVSALHAVGGAVGHAVVDEQSDRGHRYRAFDGQAAHLRTGNFVDLNVLVVRTDALRAVGGFDPSLRRMVDYDLVWRLAARHRLHLLPFVGVRYAAGSALTDRISATEAFAWDDVVKARHLVDAGALRDGVAERDPSLLSVVVPHRGSPEAAAVTLDALAAEDGLEVVLADLGSAPEDWRLLFAAAAARPRVRLARSPGPLDRAAGAWLGLAESRGSRVVVVPSGVAPSRGALATLVAALDDAAVVAPAGLLEAGVVAARADALVELDGLDPLLTDEHEVADLLLRARARGLATAEVEAALELVCPWPTPEAGRRADTEREWLRRWPSLDPGSTT